MRRRVSTAGKGHGETRAPSGAGGGGKRSATRTFKHAVCVFAVHTCDASTRALDGGTPPQNTRGATATTHTQRTARTPPEHVPCSLAPRHTRRSAPVRSSRKRPQKAPTRTRRPPTRPAPAKRRAGAGGRRRAPRSSAHPDSHKTLGKTRPPRVRGGPLAASARARWRLQLQRVWSCARLKVKGVLVHGGQRGAAHLERPRHGAAQRHLRPRTSARSAAEHVREQVCTLDPTGPAGARSGSVSWARCTRRPGTSGRGVGGAVAGVVPTGASP